MWIAVTQGVAAVAKEALAPRGEGGGGGGSSWGDSAPDAPVEQGNKEGYTFDWDLGTQERLGDAMLVMHQFEQTPAAVFPFSLGQCGEIIYNETVDSARQPAPGTLVADPLGEVGHVLVPDVGRWEGVAPRARGSDVPD
jgi:hypothetical protein